MADSRLTTGEQLASIWKLGGLAPKQLGLRVWEEIMDGNLLGRASELAYNFLLAVFPLLLFLLSVFGIFASQAIQLRDSLMFYLSRALPPAGFEVVSKTIAEVTRRSSGGKLTFGIVVTLWFAAGGMTSMISALNGAYHVRDNRPWYRVRGLALGLTAAVSVLIITTLGIVLGGSQLAEFLGPKLHLGSSIVIFWKVAQWPVALAFIVLSFSLIYYYGPDLVEKHWYWITPGSVFGVLLWLAASFGFRAYLHFFNSYSKTYGSLGAVIILLVWFYVTGFAFLVGGVINAEIEQAAAERGHPEAKPEGQKAA